MMMKINKFKGEIGLLTAEKIYNYLTDEFSECEAAELRGYFNGTLTNVEL